MKGQKIGYVRVSSFDQNVDRQLEGIELDKKFIDKASGKSVQRPQLEAMLEFAREGDTIVVHSMDRLARNLDDLRRIVQQLTKKGISIQFMKESLSFTGSDAPMSVLLLNMLGSFAEFERSLIKERQAEGIALVSNCKSSCTYFTHLFPPGFALPLDNLIQVAVALRALPCRKI